MQKQHRRCDVVLALIVAFAQTAGIWLAKPFSDSGSVDTLHPSIIHECTAVRWVCALGGTRIDAT
jgi:hypothetical protein